MMRVRCKLWPGLHQASLVDGSDTKRVESNVSNDLETDENTGSGTSTECGKPSQLLDCREESNPPKLKQLGNKRKLKRANTPKHDASGTKSKREDKEHNIFTHNPKSLDCVVCIECKPERERKYADKGLVQHEAGKITAKEFGDIVTMDQSLAYIRFRS